MSYQVLARKWRPRSFPEMVGQEHVLRALINALDNDRLHHAFLFTGTRGVGKTTIARILAKSLNCETGVSSRPCGECSSCREIDEGRFVDLIEVDAASRTKVEDTRELLDNVQYTPTRGRYKVYLIDEVHMLSNSSFNALLKTLEEPPPHVKFLLATTDPQKLPVTILSRCLQFSLKRMPPDLISGHLARVLEAEGISFEVPALEELARAADGSMRDALSLLDQAIAFGGGQVHARDVRDMLGTIDRGQVFAMLETLADHDGVALLAAIRALEEQAPDWLGVIAEVATVLHRTALAQVVPQAVGGAGDDARVHALAARLSPEEVQLFYQIAVIGRRDLPLAPDLRSGFEMAMLRMLAFRPAGSESAGRTETAGSAPRQAAPQAPVRSAAAALAAATTVPSVREAAPAASESPPRKEQSATHAPPSDSSMVREASVVREPAAPATRRAASQSEPASVVREPTPAAASTSSSDNDDWTLLVQRLPLNGPTRQFALQCALQARQGDKFELSLDPGQALMRNEKREEGLRLALEETIGRPVQLKVVIGGSGGVTPAMVQKRQSDERQVAAEQAIESDPHVQTFIDRFGGRIPPGTVRPNDES